jgi:CRISPR-associated endonuclease/helicase Cas3
VYEELRGFFPGKASDGLDRLDLLHARYLFKDRAERETRTLIRFGKPNGKVTDAEGKAHEVNRPDCAILVSTQIIEQSLDLDFDLMVTELAPVDFVLQRAGRLHRHRRTRPAGLQESMVWLCEPEVDSGGVPDFGKGKYVYEEHILLRSWLELRNRPMIRIPDDIQELIESVYAEDRDCPQDLSEPLNCSWEQTKTVMGQKRLAKEAKAKNCRILSPHDRELIEDFNRQLEEDNLEIHQSLQALTRDDETPSVSVIFLMPDEGHLCPTEGKPNLQTIRSLLHRSVNISRRGVVDALLNEELPLGWRDSPHLRHHRLIRLKEDSSGFVGSYRLSVHPALGILIDKLTKEKG